MAEKRNSPARVLRHGGISKNVRLTPQTLQYFGWRNTDIIAVLLRFSVAHGGPDELWQALEYWAARDKFASMGAAVEAALWWNEGNADRTGESAEKEG